MNRNSRSRETGAFETWAETTEEAFALAESRRVDVYVRSTLPPLGAKAGQERALRRLDAMVDRAVLDDLSVHVTGDRLCLCETCPACDAASPLVEAFGDFEEWGAAFDARAGQFFEVTAVSSSVADEHVRALVPPRVCVGLYLDESLSGVFPCRMGDRAYAVEDFFDALDGFTTEVARPVES